MVASRGKLRYGRIVGECFRASYIHTVLEFDVVGNLGGGNVQLHGVVDFDERVGVTDGSSIVGDQEWDVLWADTDLLHFAQLVLGLLGRNTVNGEATFHVIDQSEEFSGLLDSDHI